MEDQIEKNCGSGNPKGKAKRMMKKLSVRSERRAPVEEKPKRKYKGWTG